MIEQIESLDTIIVDEDVPKIHIEMTTGKAAFFYEKVRNTIGYQEEQMLRRLAITRIISRRARFDKDEQTIVSGLIWELVQSGYLKNNEVPQEKAAQILSCLKKYSVIENFFPQIWSEYFFGIMGTEIESILVDNRRNEMIINAFHSQLLRHLFGEKKDSSDYQTISDCLYYSLLQLFFKLDKSALRYYALKYKIPNWHNLNIGEKAAIKDQINASAIQIENSLITIPSSKFPKVAKLYYPLFIIIQDIAKNQPKRIREILTSNQKVTVFINQITSQYFSQTMDKLNSSILKAVLFILATKITLGLIFEIPFDRYFHGYINYQPLIINIIFPPLLMYISCSRITVPGAENSKKIVDMAKRFIHNQPLADKEKKKYQYTIVRSKTLKILMNILYSITAIITMGTLIWALELLKFNIVSGILFFFFLSAVSFLAFRIRRSATDLMVAAERESAFVTLFDFLLLPFLKIGSWLSKKFEKANFLVLIFDFILEAPFKTILEATEHWIAFMREKKDEIIS